MIVKPFTTAAEGIAHEQALLQAGKPMVMLWRSENAALVLPTALGRRHDLRGPMAAAGENGWPVVTRGTGGGIVPQGPSTLNLAIVLGGRPGFTIEDGYRLICGAISEALKRFNVSTQYGTRPGTFCDGTWNVMVGGCKLAGTAQRWRSTPKGPVVLIHAAILTREPDLSLWPILQSLNVAAFPDEPPLRAENHIALDGILAGITTPSAFPGTLSRAANDRLTAVALRDQRAA